MTHEKNAEASKLKGVYRHHKGNEYDVHGRATHTETHHRFIIYRNDGMPADEYWARPEEMFYDTVAKDGLTVARFEKKETFGMLPTFITGNQYKADYLSRQLGVDIPYHPLDLDEIQSTDLHKIVEHKLRQAYDQLRVPVLVEDVSLVFNALNGLPGPYIKWFVDQAGAEACCHMLDGFENRTAVIRCTFGYFDGEHMEFFDSELPGWISNEPKGENGFGFDTFFVHEGQSITRAEMDQAENERTYAEQMKPFPLVKAFIESLR